MDLKGEKELIVSLESKGSNKEATIEIVNHVNEILYSKIPGNNIHMIFSSKNSKLVRELQDRGIRASLVVTDQNLHQVSPDFDLITVSESDIHLLNSIGHKKEIILISESCDFLSCDLSDVVTKYEQLLRNKQLSYVVGNAHKI